MDLDDLESRPLKAQEKMGHSNQRAISTLTEDTIKYLQQAGLEGFEVHQEGDSKRIGDSFGRFFKAIGIWRNPPPGGTDYHLGEWENLNSVTQGEIRCCILPVKR